MVLDMANGTDLKALKKQRHNDFTLNRQRKSLQSQQANTRPKRKIIQNGFNAAENTRHNQNCSSTIESNFDKNKPESENTQHIDPEM